jgi:hypothetical protein
MALLACVALGSHTLACVLVYARTHVPLVHPLTDLTNLLLSTSQSNMEFSVSEAFDHKEIINTAGIDGLRLFAVQKNSSNVELDDLVDVQTPGGGWVRSNSVSQNNAALFSETMQVRRCVCDCYCIRPR